MGLSTPLKLAYRIIRPLYKINLITVEKVFNNYNRIASLYENQKTKRVGIICYSFDNKRFIYNTENYDNGYMDLPFDDIQVQVPKDYDAILKNSYGEYMIPVNEGTNHGDTIFDMNTPYCDYVKEHKQELMEFWIASRK